MIDFHIKLTDGSLSRINWYPSEYLYLDKDGTKYCFAADRGTDYQILFGSTLMRQHDFIFDIDKQMIGIARANCSDDQLMIRDEVDYTSFGNPFPVDKAEEEESEAMKEYLFCNHSDEKINAFIDRLNEAYYKEYNITPHIETPDRYQSMRKNLGRMFETIVSIASVICLVVCCIIFKEFGNRIFNKLTGRKPTFNNNLQIENELPKFDLGNII